MPNTDLLYVFDGFCYFVALFLHQLTLYRRTTDQILSAKAVTATKILLPLLIVFGSTSSFARILPLIVGIVVKVAFAVCFVVLDGTFTYSFMKFVKQARKTFGRNSTEKTFVIAKCGLYITMASWTGSSFYLISWLYPDPLIVYYFDMMHRLFATTSLVLWLKLKKDLDSQKENRSNKSSEPTGTTIVNNAAQLISIGIIDSPPASPTSPYYYLVLKKPCFIFNVSVFSSRRKMKSRS